MIDDESHQDTDVPAAARPDAAKGEILPFDVISEGLAGLQQRALGLLAGLEERKEEAAQREQARLEAERKEREREAQVPLDPPLSSKEAALNLGRMIARGERLFARLLKNADETTYQETHNDLVLMAVRTAHVTGSLIGVMHRIDGEVRHRVVHEQLAPLPPQRDDGAE